MGVERQQLGVRKASLLAAIVALGGVLRFYQSGSKSLSLDEAFSVWMGRLPVGEMLDWLVQIDMHPPLYYLLLHAWMSLGDDVTTVRALSCLLGTATIPVVFLLGRHLADAKVGLLAALILAVAPFHVRFAQDTRMYTLLALSAALALYALVRLLTDPRAGQQILGQQVVAWVRMWRATRRRPPFREIETDLTWICLILCTTTALWSHNAAVFLPIATNLIFLSHWFPSRGRAQTPSLRNWILAQLCVVVLWSPWLVSFLTQSTRLYNEYWMPAPTFGTVAQLVRSFLSDFFPSDWTWVVWSLFFGLLVVGVSRLRHRPALIGLLVIVFLTPIIGELLVSLRRPIFKSRTLIWASFPLYLFIAAGIRQIRFRPLALVAVLLLLTVNGISLREYYLSTEREQWDDAAELIAAQLEPDDTILFHASWIQIPFDYYYQSPYPSVPEHGLPVDLFDRGLLEPKMTEDDQPHLRRLIEGYTRVWLVYSHDWYTDPEGIIPPTITETRELLQVWEYRGLQVQLYGAEL